MTTTLNYISYLQNPALLAELETDTVHSWVQAHPATPIFRVILAAKYQQLDHPETATYIEQAACYVQDRKQLKTLLREWQSIWNQVEEIETIPEAIIPEIEDNKEVEEQILTEKEEQELQEVITSTLGQDTLIVETEEESEKDNSSSIVEDSTEITDEPIETPLIEEESIEEQQSDAPAEEITQEEISTKQEVFSIATDDSISEEDDIAFLKDIGKYDEPTITKELTLDWKLSPPGDGRHVLSLNDVVDSMLVNQDISYLMPWLAEFEWEATIQDTKAIQAHTGTPQVQEAKKDIEEQPKVQQSGKHSFDEWLHILEEKKTNPEQAPVFDLPVPEIFDPKDLEDIQESDNFIAITQPPEKQSEEDVVKQLAHKSISFRKELATETLAILYIKQGKKDLAINIYKKLMDKNPEKSSYFANQIEKLK